MKNRILKYSFILVALLISGSCNDDFLEKYPLDQLSSETYWNTEAELRNYNNSLYELIRNDRNYPIMIGMGKGGGLNFDEGLWYMDQMSDNLGATHNRAQLWYEVSTGNHFVQNNPRAGGWLGWDLIRRINFGLENYDRADISQAIINRYKGEARLFRGWFYAEKISKFGDVQWIDEVLNIDSEELLGTRDDREFVMEKVLEDLDYAIEHLPADWGDGANPGRIHKWAALTVKSRICLFEGTWRKYHGGSDPEFWLEQSADAARQVMDEGGFSLWNTGNPHLDYRHAHWQTYTGHENNPEVIYWRKHEPEVNTGFWSRLFWNYNGGATRSFVEDFLCEDGLPITLSPLYQGDDEIEDVFVNRDPRLRQCVFSMEDKELLNYANDPDAIYPKLQGQSIPGRNSSNTGYHVVKHWNAVDELTARHYHGASSPTLRLGEVLLTYAEAKAELGTITQGDLDVSINLLRDRAAMPHLDLNPPMDPRYANDGVSALIIEIRRERRLELFLEGHRYNDIRRWAQGKYLGMPLMGIRWDENAQNRFPGATVRATEVPHTVTGEMVPYIDVHKNTSFEPKFDLGKHYLWPLPLNVLSENPNLGQNPGW